MKYKLFFFIFIIFLSLDFLSGLGVSPSKVEIDFEPNLQTSFDMGVINDPPKEGEVEIYVNLNRLDLEVIEEFREIVSTEEPRISFKKTEGRKNLKVKLNFPEGFSKGGVHELRIGARPYINPDSEGLAAVAGNEIRIIINVPQQYVDERYKVLKKLKILRINAGNVKQGELANISILLKSQSDEEFNEVYGRIEFIRQGVKIGALETEKINIKPDEEKSLSAVLDTSKITPSILNLNVTVFYDKDYVKGNGVLNIIGEGKRGLEIGERAFNISWWWIIAIIIIFLLIIIILLLILLRKKGKKKKNK